MFTLVSCGYITSASAAPANLGCISVLIIIINNNNLLLLLLLLGARSGPRSCAIRNSHKCSVDPGS